MPAKSDLDSTGAVVYSGRAKYHLKDENGMLRCGKPVPQNRVLMSNVPTGGRLCSRCF